MKTFPYALIPNSHNLDNAVALYSDLREAKQTATDMIMHGGRHRVVIINIYTGQIMFDARYKIALAVKVDDDE